MTLPIGISTARSDVFSCGVFFFLLQRCRSKIINIYFACQKMCVLQAAKYLLRAGRIEEADAMCAKFTRVCYSRAFTVSPSSDQYTYEEMFVFQEGVSVTSFLLDMHVVRDRDEQGSHLQRKVRGRPQDVPPSGAGTRVGEGFKAL